MQVMQRLEQSLCMGLGRGDSAIRAGIHRHTFNNWLQRARAERDAEKDTVHTQFLAVIEKAEADAIFNSLMQIKANGQNWQAHAWFLERKRPNEFGHSARLNKLEKAESSRVHLVHVPVRAGSVEEQAP